MSNSTHFSMSISSLPLLTDWLRALYDHFAAEEKRLCEADFEDERDFETGETHRIPKDPETYQMGNEDVIDWCIERIALALLNNAMEDKRELSKHTLLDNFWYPIGQGCKMYDTVYTLSTSVPRTSRRKIQKRLNSAIKKWLEPTSSSVYDDNSLFSFKERLWTTVFKC